VFWKIQDSRIKGENKQIKYNSEKANNAKYRKQTTLLLSSFTTLSQGINEVDLF